MMPQDTPSRSLDKIIVRLPDGLRDELKEAAARNNRSVNAEVVQRLIESLHAEQTIVTRAVRLPAPTKEEAPYYLTQDDFVEAMKFLQRRAAERASGKKVED